MGSKRNLSAVIDNDQSRRQAAKERAKLPPDQLRFEAGKDVGEITSVSNQIRTLEQALAAAKVNLDVWEVDRWVANKWEIAAKHHEEDRKWTNGNAEGYSKRSGHLIGRDLWQVKVWLRRKAPIVLAAQDLLERIQKHAPLLPVVRRQKAKAKAGRVRRSLEISVMDPHVGLRTDFPEGDGKQDLESIAKTILSSMDDLIAKASLHGPFEEVFMPFGNDFMHADGLYHTTSAGTPQPEMEAWHKTFVYAEMLAIEMVERLRKVAPVRIYEIPGNHSRVSDFALARIVKAYFSRCKDVTVDASSSPYKFHRYGATLIGFEHGHSVAQIRLAALMANERPHDWKETSYREWHLGDQHRKGSSVPAALEEQGVSVEFLPGLTMPNEWHRLKSFNHQKRGAMAFVYDYHSGPVARLQHNL